jgi:hypothetical protein
MTIARFTNYIQYSLACPDTVSAVRWQAMLRYAVANGLLSAMPFQL